MKSQYLRLCCEEEVCINSSFTAIHFINLKQEMVVSQAARCFDMNHKSYVILPSASLPFPQSLFSEVVLLNGMLRVYM